MAKRAKLKVYPEVHFYFWGIDLVEVREKLGLTQKEFALKCEWTQQYQAELELPNIRHVLTFEKRQAFKKATIICK